MVLFIIGLSTMHVVVLRGNISVIFPLAGIINSNIIPSAFRTTANWRGLFNTISLEEQRKRPGGGVPDPCLGIEVPLKV